MARPKSEQHLWPNRSVVSQHETHRTCPRCGLIAVTRHEAGERSWKEYRRGDVIVARPGQAMPVCDGRLEKKAAEAEVVSA